MDDGTAIKRDSKKTNFTQVYKSQENMEYHDRLFAMKIIIEAMESDWSWDAGSGQRTLQTFTTKVFLRDTKVRIIINISSICYNSRSSISLFLSHSYYANVCFGKDIRN